MKKAHIIDYSLRVLIVVVSSVIYSLAVLWFLEPIHLVSTGVTGISQIINRLFLNINVNIPIGVFTLLLNIPLFIYGFKSVSHKFILYTIISVVVQSIMLLGWVPVVNFNLTPEENILLFTI